MIMYVGILNVTPDSFSDGGKYFAAEAAIKQAYELVSKGASVVDLGPQSTRPNATRLSADEEWLRLEPVLKGLGDIDADISIDTFHPTVVSRALRYFPDLIVNDITTAHNPDMRRLVVERGNRIFLSHLPFVADGDPQVAHKQHPLIDDVGTVKNELLIRRQELISLGAQPEHIILDPGIGFGKSMRLNAELVAFAQEVPSIPVLIGFSRKRFIEQHLGLDRFDKEVNARLANQAIKSGASYIRLHDIPEF